MACCFPCLRSSNSQPINSCCLIDAVSKLAYLVKETALVILLGLVAGAVPALAPASAVGYIALLATNSPEIAKIAGLVVWAGGVVLAGWLVRPVLGIYSDMEKSQSEIKSDREKWDAEFERNREKRDAEFERDREKTDAKTEKRRSEFDARFNRRLEDLRNKSDFPKF